MRRGGSCELLLFFVWNGEGKMQVMHAESAQTASIFNDSLQWGHKLFTLHGFKSLCLRHP